MVTSTVNAVERFGVITEEIDRQVQKGLKVAAEVGAETANAAAGKYTGFAAMPVRGTADGWESGVKSGNKLIANIYDSGTLGKRKRNLKQPGRAKATWTVKQKNRTYVAHRRDVTGKGVAGTDWKNKTRTAGRKALIDALSKIH